MPAGDIFLDVNQRLPIGSPGGKTRPERSRREPGVPALQSDGGVLDKVEVAEQRINVASPVPSERTASWSANWE